MLGFLDYKVEITIVVNLLFTQNFSAAIQLAIISAQQNKVTVSNDVVTSSFLPVTLFLTLLFLFH